MGSIESDAAAATAPSQLNSSSSETHPSPAEDGSWTKVQSTNSKTHLHRGRSHIKRSQSTEENVCVVAFLIQAQDEKQKEILEQIQEIRRRFDQAYSRWEPHLTLIPPFIATFSTSLSKSQPIDSSNLLRDTLDQLCTTIQTVCLEIDQHTLTLDEIGHFALKRYDTIHIRPSTTANNDAFLHLQSQLESALPQATSNARSRRKQTKDAYKPHLTLGQSSSVMVSHELRQLASQVLKGEVDKDEPFRVKVNKIQLMVKPVNRSGPYDVYRVFPLKHTT